MSSDTIRNKRVFISDIHLGDARSWTGAGHPYPYAWIRRNIETLKAFLDETAQRQDVAELVLLGDLFDQWIIPADLAPNIRLDDIAESNREVIEKIGALPQKRIEVTYVPGNHDMPFSLNDIQARKDFMARVLPEVKYVCDDSAAPPRVVYRRGLLAAEHGPMYCLCNAPDWSENPGTPLLHKSFLPLGYFVSRLVAYKEATTGKPQSDFRILAGIIQASLRKSGGEFIPEMDPTKIPERLPGRTSFARELLTGMASDASFAWDRPVNIAGLPEYPSTESLDCLSDDYSVLWSNWENHPAVRYVANNDINTCIAALNECGHISEAAKAEYLQPKRRDTNIVIFGHTHIAEIKKYCVVESIALDHIPLPSGGPYDFIYANSGSWVDSVPYCSYVETEEAPESNRCYVRLVAYAPGKTEVKGEGYVRLKEQ
jgi:UDP-2,3-diacylglucosamine pyrophosphatase LpxH